jgi:hypothetical protein
MQNGRFDSSTLARQESAPRKGKLLLFLRRSLADARITLRGVCLLLVLATLPVGFEQRASSRTELGSGNWELQCKAVGASPYEATRLHSRDLFAQ